MSDKIEEIVARHDAELHAVNQRLGSIENNLSEVAGLLQKMAHTTSRTNWNVILPSISMFITVMVLSFAPMIWGFQMHQEDIERLRSDLEKHSSMDGHGVAMEKTRHLAEKINHLDIVLQREMRLLKSENDAKIVKIIQEIERLQLRFVGHVKDGHPNRVETLTQINKEKIDKIERQIEAE